jgi:hypothetical protein
VRRWALKPRDYGRPRARARAPNDAVFQRVRNFQRAPQRRRVLADVDLLQLDLRGEAGGGGTTLE